MRYFVFSLGVLAAAAAAAVSFFLWQNQITNQEEGQAPLLASQADAVLPEKETLKEEIPFAVPKELKGVYLTRWSAGTPSFVSQVLSLKESGMNAVVADIKDFSGLLAYDTNVAKAQAIGAEQQITVKDIQEFIGKFHEAGFAVVGRIAVFQDPVFAKAHPEYALRKASSPEELWEDNKGLSWIDPAATPFWEYIAELAKDAFSAGFDEVNFDYVRFPSDGELTDISYPVRNEEAPRREIISSFYQYLAGELDGTISADLFGLTAVDTWDDMGIGQVLEDALVFFDFVSPMVYPSHFAEGFLGLENPNEHPFEVVSFSLQRAKERIAELERTGEKAAKLRPWLQYFDLAGSNVSYGASLVREQVRAVQEVFQENGSGFFLWNPQNLYAPKEFKEIMEPEPLP